MKLLLIANPVAGGDARPRIARAVAWFEAHGCAVELCLTGARGDARAAAAAARNAGFDRIVACGGDGTLNEVLNGLAPSPVPVAFLPSGTVNVLALELKLPFALEAACAVALDGRPLPVSLGQAGALKFLLMAGIGFDAAVVRAVSGRLKRRIGRLAYLVAAASQLTRWHAPQLSVTLADGSTASAGSLIVGNGRLYGGRFAVTPGARLDDPAFEVLLLAPGRLPLLRAAWHVLRGRAVAPADGRLLRTTALQVRGTAALQLDGDDVGDLPVDIELLPQAAVLMVPSS